MTPDELAAVTFVTGDITDLASVEGVLDEPRDHERHPPGGAPGPLLPRRPSPRRPGQRGRHGQHLRGRPAASRRDGAGRLHELDGGLHRRRRRPGDRPADGRCRSAPAEPLRRLQAGQRGQRADLLARHRAVERRRPADDRLRRRARPGDDQRADQGDRRGGARRAVPRVVQRPDDVPVRRRMSRGP